MQYKRLTGDMTEINMSDYFTDGCLAGKVAFIVGASSGHGERITHFDDRLAASRQDQEMTVFFRPLPRPFCD